MENQNLKEATAVASFLIQGLIDNFLFKLSRALTDTPPFPAILFKTIY